MASSNGKWYTGLGGGGVDSPAVSSTVVSSGLSQYKVSQDGESNNTIQHFGKTKASSGWTYLFVSGSGPNC